MIIDADVCDAIVMVLHGLKNDDVMSCGDFILLSQDMQISTSDLLNEIRFVCWLYWTEKNIDEFLLVIILI